MSEHPVPLRHHLDLLEVYARNIERMRTDASQLHLLASNYAGYLQSASEYSLVKSEGVIDYQRHLEHLNVIDKFEGLVPHLRKVLTASPDWHFSANQVDLLPIALVLGRRDLAEELAANVLATGRSTPFWESYVGALVALLQRKPVTPYRGKPKGMERHWALYIELMQVRSEPLAREQAVAKISASFDRCNQDRRLLNVTHIDPAPIRPLKWDLRLHFVLAWGLNET